MRRFGWSISKYLVGSVLPYFLFSWLLLSVILFFQQASRFSDIFFSVNIPRSLVFQLTIALIPNVIAFTCPMAALVGVIIGLSKMQGDSELVAIRASGVGNFAVSMPMVVLGVLLSLFALFVNITGVPFAAALAKRVGIQTALHKLESPIEPGVFNTNLGGLTIYVKEGDSSNGIWRNMYIFNQDQTNKQVRLITARLGRVDSSENDSELVLENAVVTTIPMSPEQSEGSGFASEHIGQIRLSVKTGKAELVQKLQKTDEGPEALGLRELAAFAKNAIGKERIEAQILFARRVVLSLTPLLFSLLGASLVLRFNRGGRGFGIFLALVSLIAYYLLTLLGEQMTRTTGLSTAVTGLIPVTACIGATAWFYVSNRLLLGSRGFVIDLEPLKKFVPSFKYGIREPMSGKRHLLDSDIVRNILKYFLLTLGFLSAVFLIFTAFDMWKFAGATDGGTWMLIKYLFFLLPMIYIQLAPPALMIATLATFVIKSRQNEIVTWTAAGQSVYRLLAPGFALMVAIGLFNLGAQELVLPAANQRQDALREQLRSRGVSPTSAPRSWAATARRIYNFDTPTLGGRGWRSVSGVLVYEFGEDGLLESIYRAGEGRWEGHTVILSGNAEKISLADGSVIRNGAADEFLDEGEHPFSGANQKPSHLNTLDTRAYIKEIDSDAERRSMQVSLQKKYSTVFLPLLIVLFTAPFGLSLSRKGKVITVGYAVAVWLVFTGVSNSLEQMGLSGQLPTSAAVWLPLLGFSAIGVILLSRIRT